MDQADGAGSGVRRYLPDTLLRDHVGPHLIALKHTAALGKTLQHATTRCSTPQHKTDQADGAGSGIRRHLPDTLLHNHVGTHLIGSLRRQRIRARQILDSARDMQCNPRILLPIQRGAEVWLRVSVSL